MSDGGAFSSGFANAYRMMMDREELKRKQDANLALTNAYLEMEEQRRQSQIAPQKQAFDAATGNAVDAQMRAEASGMTDAIMANNPALTSRVAGVSPAPTGYTGNIDLSNRPSVRQPDGSTATVASIGVNIDGKEVLIPTVSDDGRMLSPQDAIAQYKATGKHLGTFNTPEESTAFAKALSAQQGQYYGINNNFQANNQANMAQANTQAQSAQALLAEAEKRYPPSVLAKMAPLLSKGVPFEKLYAFAESENAKEINRTKTAELNKAYKEVFSNKDLTDEQKAIMLLSVNPSDPIGKMFAERSGKKDLGFTLGQGQTRFDSQGRPIVSVAPRPDKPTEPRAGTWIERTNPETGDKEKFNTITGKVELIQKADPFAKKLVELDQDEKREMSYLKTQKPPYDAADMDYQKKVEAWNAKLEATKNKYDIKRKSIQGEKAYRTEKQSIMKALRGGVSINDAIATVERARSKYEAAGVNVDTLIQDIMREYGENR